METLIYLDPASPLTLQAQLREKLVTAILAGAFGTGDRLPSSRRLAEQLGIARNTVTLAYERLIEEGYLVSRERSGIFVNPDILQNRVQPVVPDVTTATDPGPPLPGSAPENILPRRNPDWSAYPYPFLSGCYNQQLYETAELREAARLAMSTPNMMAWALASEEFDEPGLVEEICRKLLPRRGISAQPAQVLVTVSHQQALSLVAQLLIEPGTRVVMENPGNPRFRGILAEADAAVTYHPVDDEGLSLQEGLTGVSVCYVTPSHQYPTGVTMATRRRLDLLAAAGEAGTVIIEDDRDTEINYFTRPHPALRAMGGGDRVVYVSSLSEVLAPGLGIGFIVAEPSIIRRLRMLRNHSSGLPPVYLQKIVSYLLSLGHYDAHMRRLHTTLGARWNALREALNHYLQSYVSTSRVEGGTGFWVEGPAGMRIRDLMKELEQSGVLVDDAGAYFAPHQEKDNYFILSVGGIAEESIRDGVEKIASVLRRRAGRDETSGAGLLSGKELRRLLPDARIYSRTVYGEPFNIHLKPDGRLAGIAGYARDDRDEGRWWVEGDYWYRQWRQWSYGEAARFRVVVEDNIIRWFNDQGIAVDRAFIRLAENRDN